MQLVETVLKMSAAVPEPAVDGDEESSAAEWCFDLESDIRGFLSSEIKEIASSELAAVNAESTAVQEQMVMYYVDYIIEKKQTTENQSRKVVS